MKQINELSIKDIETLCQLYNECKLSVLEESELEYLLLSTSFSSELINETRKLMGISRQIKFEKKSQYIRRTVYRRFTCWTLGVAASLGIIVGIFLLKNYSTPRDDSYYIGYVEGKPVNEETARNMAKAEIVKVASFIQYVEKQKSIEQDKVRIFTNHINQQK
ncbi:hypothetical protein NEE14_006500 [Parabacteroides sp. AD58]|uniref:Uncharacterized protein n=1 Tax=Parabacteroides absconsus TaxID=2951805 RepID=A0ABZ2ISB7_9BACT|nr:hypothetical protein [Parabacteroides sp. AD58]MCM6901597.1 hypothetical protein [Parabacteroides sp. AD58]